MIRQLEVDGVPTLLSPATGPIHAGLAFRVGTVDESLPQRGITHLIQHLVLSSLGVTDCHDHATSDASHTYFDIHGSPADVVPFLNGVCESLLNLPTAQLSMQKEVLRSEEAGRGQYVEDALAIARHGARGFGTGAFPEWGLSAVTVADLKTWVSRYFTAQNAVLWVTADDVPVGLHLGLPQGQRQAWPAATSALPTRPAYFSSPRQGVAWSAVVPRSPAADVFAGLLERSLRRSVGGEDECMHPTSADCEPRGDGTAVVMAYVYAPRETQDAVLGGVVDVLTALRVGRIEQADLDSVVTSTVAALEQAEPEGWRLPGQALRLLNGDPVEPVAEAVAQVLAVTRADVAATAAAAWDDGLLMTPPGTRGDWAGLVAAPTVSESAVDGDSHTLLGDPRARLVGGPEGVSFVDADGELSTVRFAGCEAVLAWPDGGRRLIGPDAEYVSIEPTLYASGAALTALVDTNVPAARRIEMPARDRREIPRPERGVRPATSTLARVGRFLKMMVLSWVLILVIFLGLALILDLAQGSDTVSTDVVVLAIVVVVSVAAGRALRRLRRIG